MDSKQTIIFLTMIAISFIIFFNNILLGLIAFIISFIVGKIFNVINAIRRNNINNKIYREMKKENKEE